MNRTWVRTSLVIVGLAALLSMARAQNSSLSDEHRAAMKKLAFLVGTWEGEAWTAIPNQPKETVKQKEVVRWGLDESILIVEGLGKSLDADTQKETVVHEALGILSYDPQAKQYRMNSYVADGRSTVAKAALKNPGEFVWTMDTPNGYTVRYTIKINDLEQWTEVGEWSRDGENWQPFFGMTLNRVK
jgi:hypothetical protein